MTFLCDTNVVSELSRPVPNAGVVAWARTVPRLVLSVVTVEEIRFGLAWKPNARVERWFERFFEEQCQVLPVTEEVARASGRLRGALRARGEVRTQADMFVAATASLHGLTLVTRNERDFQGAGVHVLNPFS